MPIKRKTGEKVTWKEFFRQFKKGMEEVTPLQQSVVTQWGQIISAIGAIWGIVFSFRIGYKWMAVILFGGMIVLGVQMLGNWQKKVILKKMDEVMKNAEEISLEEFTELKKQEVTNGNS